MRRPFSRRDFLQVTAGAGAAVLASSVTACGQPAQAARGRLGVQLYCFRHLLEEDFPGTFAQVAQLGFEGFEYAGYYGYSAQELRQMQDDHGVVACGTHIGMQAIQGDELQRTIEFNLGIGNPNLIVASIGNQWRESRDAILRAADVFNEAAEELRPHGLRTGYHCHAYSFQEMHGGESMWKIFADNTADDVILQLDTGNAAAGGANIPQVIRDHPGRVNSMHVKPYSPSHEDPFDPFIGDDELQWPLIFELSESIGGIEWYVIEYEQPTHPPLEALAANLANVRAIKGV